LQIPLPLQILPTLSFLLLLLLLKMALLLEGRVEGVIAVLVLVGLFGTLASFLTLRGEGVEEEGVGKAWEEVLTVVATAPASAALVLCHARISENVVHDGRGFLCREKGDGSKLRWEGGRKGDEVESGREKKGRMDIGNENVG